MSRLPKSDEAGRIEKGFRTARLPYQRRSRNDERKNRTVVGWEEIFCEVMSKPLLSGLFGTMSGTPFLLRSADINYSDTRHAHVFRLPRKPYPGRSESRHLDAAYLSRKMLQHGNQRLLSRIDRIRSTRLLLERPIYSRHCIARDRLPE